MYSNIYSTDHLNLHFTCLFLYYLILNVFKHIFNRSSKPPFFLWCLLSALQYLNIVFKDWQEFSGSLSYLDRVLTISFFFNVNPNQDCQNSCCVGVLSVLNFEYISFFPAYPRVFLHKPYTVEQRIIIKYLTLLT